MREPLIFRMLSALDARTRVGVAGFLAVALLLVPVLHLALPADSALHVSTVSVLRSKLYHRTVTYSAPQNSRPFAASTAWA